MIRDSGLTSMVIISFSSLFVVVVFFVELSWSLMRGQKEMLIISFYGNCSEEKRRAYVKYLGLKGTVVHVIRDRSSYLRFCVSR